MEINLYIYRAEVVRIIDADTIVLNIDLGFSIKIEREIRFYGLNCPEKSTQKGKEAISLISLKLIIGANIYVKTIKDKNDKYGRLLGIIYYGENNTCLNKELLETNIAVPYMQSKEKYW